MNSIDFGDFGNGSVLVLWKYTSSLCSSPVTFWLSCICSRTSSRLQDVWPKFPRSLLLGRIEIDLIWAYLLNCRFHFSVRGWLGRVFLYFHLRYRSSARTHWLNLLLPVSFLSRLYLFVAVIWHFGAPDCSIGGASGCQVTCSVAWAFLGSRIRPFPFFCFSSRGFFFFFLSSFWFVIFCFLGLVIYLFDPSMQIFEMRVHLEKYLDFGRCTCFFGWVRLEKYLNLGRCVLYFGWVVLWWGVFWLLRLFTFSTVQTKVHECSTNLFLCGGGWK